MKKSAFSSLDRQKVSRHLKKGFLSHLSLGPTCLRCVADPANLLQMILIPSLNSVR